MIKGPLIFPHAGLDFSTDRPKALDIAGKSLSTLLSYMQPAAKRSEASVLLVMSQGADGVCSTLVESGASKMKQGVCSHSKDFLGKTQPPALLF